MNLDELRALRGKIERLRYLEARPGLGFQTQADLRARWQSMAARLGPADDPRDLSPAALVAGLCYARLDPVRELSFAAALEAMALERYGPADPIRALLLDVAGGETALLLEIAGGET